MWYILMCTYNSVSSVLDAEFCNMPSCVSDKLGRAADEMAAKHWYKGDPRVQISANVSETFHGLPDSLGKCGKTTLVAATSASIHQFFPIHYLLIIL
jgi:hypothetical protein